MVSSGFSRRPSADSTSSARRHPEITIVWADSAYAGKLVTWAKKCLSLTIKTVSRPKDASWFIVLLVRRTNMGLDDARPPTCTRLRTTRPALRNFDHLGGDYPHDQASRQGQEESEPPAYHPAPGGARSLRILLAGSATAQSSSPISGIGTLAPSFSAFPSGSPDFFMAREESLGLARVP
ncbi:hypothetical protein Scani_33620 [Streptomyces caniferus]|uniref:Uncharacterized protein n=1 Tax=Streptomyces caniferus TaxID=285557 RepID=A0A640S8H1_9ACTN|nr:hypothetical protein Scani_33620 [Streptomyces caniferus]